MESVPAYAGVIVAECATRTATAECSRVCGGDPSDIYSIGTVAIVFPRMRG